MPNGQGIYTESRYFDINVEHINYYTVESLARLIGKSGLEIISIGEILDGFHIGVYVRKKERKNTFMEEKNRDVSHLMDYIEKYHRIALWGAGIKGRTYVQLLQDSDISSIQYIFDSNKAISGCYMGNCNVPIQYPDKEKILQCDLIIVTALEYYKEIRKQLETEYDFRGTIISVGEMRDGSL